MKKKIIVGTVILFMLVFMSFIITAEIIYDSDHNNSQYNYCVVTDSTTTITGRVQIKGSYVDNGDHCYRGGIRCIRDDNWTGSLEITNWYYTAYATGPNDSTLRTKTLQDNHGILNGYEYEFQARFYWVPDGSSYWPVAYTEVIETAE